jgi:hypothetical protein
MLRSRIARLKYAAKKALRHDEARSSSVENVYYGVRPRGNNSGKYEGNPYNELMSNKHGSTGEFDYGFALNDGSFIHATGAFSYNNALGKSIPTSHVVRLAHNADSFEAWGNVITQTIYCVFCAKQF